MVDFACREMSEMKLLTHKRLKYYALNTSLLVGDTPIGLFCRDWRSFYSCCSLLMQPASTHIIPQRPDRVYQPALPDCEDSL